MTPRSPSMGSVATMRSAARRMTLNVPIRLMLTTRAKSASGRTPCLPMTRPGVPTPAHFTATRSGPSSPATSRAALTWSGSVTSAAAKAPPIASACSAPAEEGRSIMTTCAPALPSRFAVARPRPDAPPVTTAELPWIFIRPAPRSCCAGPGRSCTTGRATERAGHRGRSHGTLGNVSDAPISAALFDRAQTVIPGGVNSPVRAFRAVGGTPRFMASGEGAYLADADGQRYVDLVSSWGPMILGHAHPEVVAAVQAAAAAGLSFGTPTLGEVELAEELIRRVAPVEQVRLVNSGT